jgi:Protein of unknown function (DUF2806)
LTEQPRNPAEKNQLKDAELQFRPVHSEGSRQQQLNLEKISSHAALELLPEQSVPDAKPDEDWTARFFDYAKNISSEQMQEVWGRILAGEIKQPGSYSLKTLDIARNITKKDAESFEKIAAMSFATIPEDVFLPAMDSLNRLLTDREITEGAMLNLADLGLLHPARVGDRPVR